MIRRILFAVSFLCIVACGNDSSRTDIQSISLTDQMYPKSPDSQLTPGYMCDRGNTFRYRERIRYCKRSVSSNTKAKIIAEYDNTLNYKIRSLNRNDFKIDHFIPLCFGGSNDRKNLWPQHKSVYEKTDVIEHELCQLLMVGKVTQKFAVEQIRIAKLDISKADSILATVQTIQ